MVNGHERKENMNRLVKICAVCVAVVWLFCMGMMIGSFAVRQKAKNELTSQSSQQQESSSAQSQTTDTSKIVIDMVTNQTTLPAKKDDPLGLNTTANGNMSTFATNSGVDEITPQSDLPSGNEEIVKALVNAINATKATQNFSLKKTENTSVTIDSVTGGIESIVNSIVEKQLNKPDTECTFSNGVDSKGTGKTPNSVIAPINKMASLSSDAIQSANVTAGMNGAYTVEVTLKSETQTLTQSAKNHSGVFETFDFGSLDLPSSVSMSELYVTYADAKIKAQINKNGRLDSITYTLPMTDGGGDGKMIVPVNVKMHGRYECTVTCTY